MRKLLGIPIGEPDYEWLMTDASHIKVHSHADGARGGDQGMERNKRGIDTRIHLAVDAQGMPLKVVATAGIVADCAQAGRLGEGIRADYLVVDKGYASDEIVSIA